MVVSLRTGLCALCRVAHRCPVTAPRIIVFKIYCYNCGSQGVCCLPPEKCCPYPKPFCLKCGSENVTVLQFQESEK
jgi:hypothetical protein